MKNEDVAKAFVHGYPKHVRSAVTNGQSYWYHDSIIATWHGEDVIFYWCGFYTVSTAQHMNNILSALGAQRVSYTQAKKDGQQTFVVKRMDMRRK